MKKGLLICSGIILAVTLTACGNKKNNNNGQESTVPQTTESSSAQQTQIPETGNTENPGSTEADVPMEELRAAVEEVLGENYWPNSAIEADVLAEVYGITEDMYDDYFGEMPMISVNVDTLIIVKAKEGQAEAVEDALNAYRDMQINDALQYPMNVGKVQASQIEAIGSYVCFVQLGADVDEEMDQGEDAVIKKCQEANEAALDAIRNRLWQ